MNLLARIISYAFHPLLMATYLFSLLAYFVPAALYPLNAESHLLFLTLIFVITFVLPVLLLSMLRLFGSIRSFTLEKREERVFPSLMVVVLYASLTYMLTLKNRIGLDDGIFKFLLIIDCLILMGALITLFYKISIHALGMMGIVGILIPLNIESDNTLLFKITIGIIVLAGIVMSARLQLNAHSLRQILVGALTGVLIGFLGSFYCFIYTQ